MSRVETFAFKVNTTERQLIADLAKRLHRTQSDAVRFVVTEAAKELIKTAPIMEPQLNREEVHVQA